MSAFWCLFRGSWSVQRFSPLIWGGSLGSFCALIAAIWPSIEDSIGKAIQSYPQSLKDAFNIQTLNTVEQYVDAEMLSFIVPLAIAYYAIRLVSRDTVVAEERVYLDSLLSLPLSRRTLAWASLMVAATMTLTALLLMWAMTWSIGQAAGTHISARITLEGFLAVWPLGVAFAGLAMLTAGWFHRAGMVTGLCSGILVAMYVLDLVGKLSEPIKPLRYLSAFYYYGSTVQNGLDWFHIGILLFAGTLLAGIGVELFRRKDLL